MDPMFMVNLVVWYAVFLFSTSLHEAAHALAAARGGDFTAYNSGQVTLNPVPHIQREKVGMIFVPLLSFAYYYFAYGSPWMLGWASAPFNPFWAARHPRKSFVMSLSGPLSHLLPALAAWCAMLIGLRTGIFVPGIFTDSQSLVAPAQEGQALLGAFCLLLDVLFKLNIILCIFNLLPFPPMDGSEVWFLFIKREEDRLRWRYQFNSYSFAGIMLAWYVFPKVFPPVYLFFIRLLYKFI